MKMEEERKPHRIYIDALATRQRKQIIYWKELKLENLLRKNIWNELNYYQGKPLLSFSSFTNAITKIKLANIPPLILEQKRQVGSDVMKYLKMIIDNKITDLDEISWPNIKTRMIVESIIRTLVENKFKIECVELCITNNYWYGYIDVIFKYKVENSTSPRYLYGVMEIKTRSSFEVRDSDILQTKIYNTILGNSRWRTILLIVNDKTYESKLIEMDWKDKRSKEVIRTTNKYLNFWLGSEYEIKKPKIQRQRTKSKNKN